MTTTAGTSFVNGGVSYWYRAAGGPPAVLRPPLEGTREYDVCVVGGGFTGLWTAYYLARSEPSLRVCVLEAEFAGFGASGRNGGWLSGLLPGSREALARRHGRGPVAEMQAEMNASVDEVVAVTHAEGIPGVGVKGGTLRIAVNDAQATRLRTSVADDHGWGVPGVELLGPAEAAARIRVDGARLAAWTPHCAAIQPAEVVRGLADVVERLGVHVYESTPVVRLEPGRAVTTRGVVRARAIVRATEGFTSTLPGHRRTWLPMNSSMIVTEPLPTAVWDEIGWTGGETLGDSGHMHLYAQRTADGRIAIGGRGMPYRFGSRGDVRGRTPDHTVRQLRGVLARVLPQAGDVGVEQAWCGLLAVPRDWCAGVSWDPATGLGWAGGYVGHGVTSTNLAGRTLRDLVLGRDTRLTRLPWVGHRTRRWEPEPLRWLGVRGMYLAYRLADRHEAGGRTRTSPVAVVADRITGAP